MEDHEDHDERDDSHDDVADVSHDDVADDDDGANIVLHARQKDAAAAAAAWHAL